jgi:hypothetical protein
MDDAQEHERYDRRRDSLLAGGIDEEVRHQDA